MIYATNILDIYTTMEVRLRNQGRNRLSMLIHGNDLADFDIEVRYN